MTLRHSAVTLLMAIAAVAVSQSAQAAAITSQFTVTGDVGDPGTTFDLSQLQALPVATQQDTYTAQNVSTTDTYTGVSLWNVLTAAGGITVNPAVKNDALDHYVVATGSDGYTVVYAAGEIAPTFGNRPYLVAYGDTGNQLGNGGSSGFARVTAPGDIAGGRYVSNLATISVGAAPAVPATGGQVTTQLQLSGNVARAGYYDLAGLTALSPQTLTAIYQSGKTTTMDTYTGVSLWDLINSAGLLTDSSIKNDVLRDIAVITGSDGYQTVISLGEIDPAFGDQPDLVAYSDIDGQLGDNGPDGFARLVVPGDTLGGRYISNIASIEVIDVTNTPEPATLSILAAALAGVTLVRRRRNRTTNGAR